MPAVAISSLQALNLQDLDLPVVYTKQLRRADELTKAVVNSTYLGLDSAPMLDLVPEKIGLFLGTSFGPLETNFRFLDSLLDDGEGQASPTLFSHSVHNAAAGYLARLFSINGPAITISSYAWPFLAALEQASLMMCSGTINRAIVVSGEMYSPLLEHAGKKLKEADYKFCQTGAVTWILDRVNERKLGNNIIINKIEMSYKPCDVTTFLTRTGEEWFFDNESCKVTELLSYAFLLTRQIQKKLTGDKKGEFNWSIKAPFGQAGLFLSC